MKYSDILLRKEARQKLIDGAKMVHDAVATTLGPRGMNIVVWKEHDTQVLHDGVKIANEVNPKNRFENAGAEILKQAARRTVETVGDGTTLSVILGYAIMYEALALVESGVKPMALKRGLNKGKNLIIKEIRKLAQPVKGKKHKVQVATIASEDKSLGKLIGGILHKTGNDGVISVEDSTGPETFVDHEEGMQLDSGYKTEYFVTNPRSMTATVTKPVVLVTDYNLSDIHAIIPLLKNVIEENNEHNLVFIAQDIEGSVLATLVQNKIGPFRPGQKQLNSLAIRAPSFQQTDVLQDVAMVLGAKFISKESKFDLKKLTIGDLGTAETITSTKNATVIQGGGGDKKVLNKRVDSLKLQIKEEDNEFQQEKLRERLAKLTGGIYVVHVGGATEMESREKKERAIDAVLATKAAIEDGIIPGGETVYLKIVEALKPKNENEDYAYRILTNALKAPFTRLVENAGMNSGEWIYRLRDKDVNFGVNVETGELEDLVKSGVIDPAKVAIEAIRNAVSVAISMITSYGIVCDVEEEKK